jgi:hypothetical protein
LAVSSAKVVGTTSSLRLSYFVLMVDLYSQYLALTLTVLHYYQKVMIRLMTCAITELKKEYGRMPKKEETGCINRMIQL